MSSIIPIRLIEPGWLLVTFPLDYHDSVVAGTIAVLHLHTPLGGDDGEYGLVYNDADLRAAHCYLCAAQGSGLVQANLRLACSEIYNEQ